MMGHFDLHRSTTVRSTLRWALTASLNLRTISENHAESAQPASPRGPDLLPAQRIAVRIRASLRGIKDKSLIHARGCTVVKERPLVWAILRGPRLVDAWMLGTA